MNYLENRRGLLLVLSSPSGAGKSTIAKHILSNDNQIQLSISVTTRTMRKDEKNGREYHFINKDEFNKMIENDELLEYAKVFDNYYGTPKKPVLDMLLQGKDVLFDIDWQGTQQLSENMKDDIVRIFVLPPSIQDLEQRLYSRAQDSKDIIKKRMDKAFDEISHWAEYEWIIINDNLDKSVQQVQAILTSERLRKKRQKGISSFIKQLNAQQ